MNKASKIILGLALLCCLVIVRGAVAQNGTTIDPWLIGGGGGRVTQGNLVFNDTLGQPVIGPAGNEGIHLWAGYWPLSDSPTAADLVFYTAHPQVGGILLRWETANEVDLLGFNLYRASSPQGERVMLNEAMIEAQKPGGMQGAVYQYLDDTPIAGLRYWYWLEAVKTSGSSQYVPTEAAWFYEMYLPVVRDDPPG